MCGQQSEQLHPSLGGLDFYQDLQVEPNWQGNITPTGYHFSMTFSSKYPPGDSTKLWKMAIYSGFFNLNMLDHSSVNVYPEGCNLI